ncbi:MAG: general secretion pathway protein GspK [Phycisphaerae bacterium]|nr:general secretion pathway protein GspK [Phycisphaerae bacterium]
MVLLILALLGLLAVSFAFQVNANCAATQVLVDKMQTRLAAEAGFQYVTLLLRDDAAELTTEDDDSQKLRWVCDVNGWHDNPEKMRGVLVWSAGTVLTDLGEVEELASEEEEQETYEPAYRFSIVADDPNNDENKIRYGITDESSKLNINTATEEQLTRLIGQTAPEDTPVQELVGALLDWRDSDEDVRSNGVESEFYRQLRVPYRCKNAPFETVEELLMVRGFTGQILYGEDCDRNGLLSLNEDDGETSFPLDNEDGLLNRGLHPYITVHSRDYNRANDNTPRVALSGDNPKARARLEEYFTAEETDYLMSQGPAAAKQGSLSLLLEGASTNGVPSPFELEDFPRIVDRCALTMIPELPGRINVNTATVMVLSCLEGLTEEDIAAIVQKRAELTSDVKLTTAWLLTEGVLDLEKYDAIADQITARGLQFTAEVVGYADHVGTRTRLQIIFALRGPVPQIMYYRDLTNLGVTYPLRRFEEEEWSQASDGAG